MNRRVTKQLKALVLSSRHYSWNEEQLNVLEPATALRIIAFYLEITNYAFIISSYWSLLPHNALH